MTRPKPRVVKRDGVWEFWCTCPTWQLGTPTLMGRFRDFADALDRANQHAYQYHPPEEQ